MYFGTWSRESCSGCEENLSLCEPSWEVIEEVVYVDVDVNGTANDDLDL